MKKLLTLLVLLLISSTIFIACNEEEVQDPQAEWSKAYVKADGVAVLATDVINTKQTGHKKDKYFVNYANCYECKISRYNKYNDTYSWPPESVTCPQWLTDLCFFSQGGG